MAKKKPSAQNSNKKRFAAMRKPKHECLHNAHAVLRYGIDSANSFAESYSSATGNRGRGAPSHVNQDLLRAMLVMAGATLDATAKQLIQDALPVLIDCSEATREELSKRLHRSLLKNLDDGNGQKFAAAMLSNDPRAKLLDDLINDLTGNSLQSHGEIMTIAGLFGIDKNAIPNIGEAMHVRNRIIHEMDCVLSEASGTRKRRQHNKDDMYSSTDSILDTAKHLICEIDTMLNKEEHV